MQRRRDSFKKPGSFLKLSENETCFDGKLFKEEDSSEDSFGVFGKRDLLKRDSFEITRLVRKNETRFE